MCDMVKLECVVEHNVLTCLKGHNRDSCAAACSSFNIHALYDYES
jgi:hypothetical protein